MSMETMTVTLPKHIKAAIAREAEHTGRTLEDCARDVLSAHVAQTLPPTFEQLADALRENSAWLANEGIARVAVFGSVARGDVRPGSDVDLLVEFAPDASPRPLRVFALKSELSERLGVPVDVATWDILRPSVAEEVRREARSLYP